MTAAAAVETKLMSLFLHGKSQILQAGMRQ
jgi:hypothetical protein